MQIKPLCVFEQFALPLVYDDSLSNYETISKVIAKLNEIIGGVNSVIDQVWINQKDIQQINELIDQIQGELDKIANGEYMEEYIDALAKWIDKNLVCMVSRIVKYVFFGLSDDGYFVAFIPPSWDFLEFDTSIDPNDPNYGHLQLIW